MERCSHGQARVWAHARLQCHAHLLRVPWNGESLAGGFVLAHQHGALARPLFCVFGIRFLSTRNRSEVKTRVPTRQTCSPSCEGDGMSPRLPQSLPRRKEEFHGLPLSHATTQSSLHCRLRSSSDMPAVSRSNRPVLFLATVLLVFLVLLYVRLSALHASTANNPSRTTTAPMQFPPPTVARAGSVLPEQIHVSITGESAVAIMWCTQAKAASMLQMGLTEGELTDVPLGSVTLLPDTVVHQVLIRMALVSFC